MMQTGPSVFFFFSEDLVDFSVRGLSSAISGLDHSTHTQDIDKYDNEILLENVLYVVPNELR